MEQAAAVRWAASAEASVCRVRIILVRVTRIMMMITSMMVSFAPLVDSSQVWPLAAMTGTKPYGEHGTLTRRRSLTCALCRIPLHKTGCNLKVSEMNASSCICLMIAARAACFSSSCDLRYVTTDAQLYPASGRRQYLRFICGRCHFETVSQQIKSFFCRLSRSTPDSGVPVRVPVNLLLGLAFPIRFDSDPMRSSGSQWGSSSLPLWQSEDRSRTGLGKSNPEAGLQVP